MTDSNRDKRARARQALTDPDTAHQSDRQIARRLKVSQPFVSMVRRELEGEPTDNRYHPTPPPQVTPDRPGGHPPLTGDALLSAGCSPRLAQRIAARLAAMPTDERQRLEAMLADVLI